MDFCKILLPLISLAIFCVAKPVENENIKNEINTTPCPEELAKQKLEGVENEMMSDEQNSIRFEQTTAEIGTPTPSADELNASDANSAENALNDLEKTLLELSENEDELDGSKELNKGNAEIKKQEETTTICPEELVKNKLENAEKKEQVLKKFPETSNEISNNFVQNSKPSNFTSANALQNTPQISIEIPKSNDEQDKINQDSEDRFENAVDFKRSDKNETEIEKSEDLTTICPEELLQKQQVNKQTKELENKVETNKNESQSLSEDSNASTTMCPEEATNTKQASGNNEISVKTLLSVQKDSALFKLVKNKLQPINARSKRQTASYSPYYINQPSYTSEGIALNSGDTSRPNKQNYNADKSVYSTYQNNQKLSVSSQQNYQRPVSYNNVKTYQQMQRQYQNTYPKSYQNYVKQVKGYQNQNPYARYTNNGNKNYYKTKTSASRRQLQSGARPFTSTARSTRPTIKKFRPSPVFA